MPRRPRPLHRHRKGSDAKLLSVHSSLGPVNRESQTSDGEAGADLGFREVILDNGGQPGFRVSKADDEDEGGVDALRATRWMDEDELEDKTEDEKTTGPSNLNILQNDLSSLPLGALRKAQYMLAQAEVYSEASGEGELEDAGPSFVSDKGKEKVKPEWSLKPKMEIAKRSNKHAPMEVTSKRPVTRKRMVVEVKTVQPRDPRFLSLSGEFSSDKFQKSYGFLVESHKRELQVLRENLNQARKRLASSPRDQYEERAKEVERLELAVKRAESMVNKDRRDKIEREALVKVKEQEREKRRDGKGEWHLKKSNEREVLMKARYDSLAAEGGKRAVKKAIEKRQKKLGQKEKRGRPGEKRIREDDSRRGKKRQRLE